MSGWYPDPTGRFEYRFHNGDAWTADVSGGGQRFVDPFVDGPAPAGRNGLATAGMVCGIVALAVAWIPFIAYPGLVTAVVAIVLSIAGLSRSRPSGRGRGFAIAGLITGTIAIAAAVLGIVLTAVLLRAVDRYENPAPHEAELTSCSIADGLLTAQGEITNTGTDRHSFTVLVSLQPGSPSTERHDRVEVIDVEPGATADFTAKTASTNEATEPTCTIEAVNGPAPFGLDPGLFE